MEYQACHNPRTHTLDKRHTHGNDIRLQNVPRGWPRPRGRTRRQHLWPCPRLGLAGLVLGLVHGPRSVPWPCPWPRRAILGSSGRGQNEDREFHEILVEIILGKPSSKLRKTKINCSYSYS